MIRLLMIGMLGVFLAGCQHEEELRSVMGSECKIFEAPKYAVRGKQQYDQDVIDEWVEGGVGGCKWKRPAVRPPEIDSVARTVKVPVTPAKKPSLYKRIKAKVLPKSKPYVQPAPVPYLLPPAPEPRDPVDELLDPR